MSLVRQEDRLRNRTLDMEACPVCRSFDYDESCGCDHCEVDGGALTQRRFVALDALLEWLEGRTGAHGGGFTSADDVRAAIEHEFGADV